MAFELLSVSALGPLQIRLGENNLGGWRYLDSPELLLYLLCFTAAAKPGSSSAGDLHGKTKEQIGQALWPDASSEQLDSNLKARLHDLRTRLGAREWVLFENETYKFNYTLPCAFDVNTFTQEVYAAEQAARAQDFETAIAGLRRAVGLYRGDLMDDYRKRRTAQRAYSGDDDIEWYVRKRYELQAVLRRALEQLGELHMERAQYEHAAEVYRDLAARDEYDDQAHRHLLLALARQGRRSQALRHYRLLVKQRPDTPPEPALEALVEQIKRGEITPVTAPGEAQKGAPALSAAVEPNVPAPFQVPADLHRFVGRTRELQALREEIRQLQTAQPFCLVGMGGIGKTSLAVHLAHAVRDEYPDAVLWGHAAASEPMAILDSWARSFGSDYSGLPDLESRAAALRSLLADKKVFILLDDVSDPARVRPLLLNGAGHCIVITTRDADVGAALGARVFELPVLSAGESADLLTRIVGEARVHAEADAARDICVLLGQLPLALDITASRLASRPRWTLGDMVARLQDQVKRLDELELGDRAVRASFAISWDALRAGQRHVFERLGAFDGRSMTVPALAHVAELDERAAREHMDALVALSLLSFEGSARYRQHPLLADYAREKLGDARAARERIAGYYLRFATDQRHSAVALDDEWDNVSAGIEIADRQGMWQTVIDYGDVLTGAWVARGRFAEARRAYPLVMRAARELEEQDPYIAASLNWGKACIDQSDYVEARQHLEEGLQTSREVDDAYGTATAQFLLGRWAVVQSAYDEAEPHLQESEELYEKLGDRAGVARVLYMRARIRMSKGEYAAAEEWGTRSLALFKTLEPNHDSIVMMRYMGRIQDYLENVDAAIAYCQEAVALAERLGDLGEYASGLYDLTAILRYRDRLDEARGYGESSLTLIRKMGDRQTESLLNEELCMIALKKKEYEAALAYGERALALATELPDPVGVLNDLLQLGDIYENLGRVDKACGVRSEALPKARAAEHPRTSEVEAWLEGHCAAQTT